MCVFPLCETAEENKIHFNFVCQALNQIRNVYIYPQADAVREPTFRNVIEMFHPKNCVNLAKYITEAEKIKIKGLHNKTQILSDVEKKGKKSNY